MNNFKAGDKVTVIYGLGGKECEIQYVHGDSARIKSLDTGGEGTVLLVHLKLKSKPKIKHLCHNPKKLEIEFDTEAECMAAIDKISEAIS